MSEYQASADRYQTPDTWFRRCGQSGLMLPALSLGCWHNFGGKADDRQAAALLRRAFDLGVTHFDLANNYGPPPGSAETRVGQILSRDFGPYRDELIISSKAGYRMQPGPYGEWGSRKYLIASAEASLKRLQLDYVDLFYSHRYDPNTPLEETIGALDTLVRQGKALYVGISSYDSAATIEAVKIARELHTPLIIHQPSYHMFNRNIEKSVLDDCHRMGLGVIVFSPLAQGLLTDKYLDGIPADSRAADPDGFLQSKAITEDKVEKVRRLNKLAEQRGQSMAQLALAWTLRDSRVTSAIFGARTVEQLENSIAAREKMDFTASELDQIETILGE